MICEKCSSENIIEGKLDTVYGVRFIKKGTENKLRPESYKVVAKACTDCGHLFDFKIELNKKKKL
ncbi:MAG: hypothetical protein E7342_00950 [Clostridiales bacterium]|nr:hypothetical protein [Clostridiales bacterium]